MRTMMLYGLMAQALIVFAGVALGQTTSQHTSYFRDCRVSEGVVADGVSDDAERLNRCLENAVASGQGMVQLPCGKIKVNLPINDTNMPSLIINGCGANQDYATDTPGQSYGVGITEILCNTGTVCWDATGSGRTKLKNFLLRIDGSFPTPSAIGFLFGRDNAKSGIGWVSGTGTYCFSEENVLDNVWVYADSAPQSTVIGRIGVYNIGAEQFVILGGGIIADAPLFLSPTNDLLIASPYQTLASGCPASMSEVKIGHGAVFMPWTGAAIRLRQVLDLEVEAATEIINGMIGKNHNPPFLLDVGPSTNIFLRGQLEGFDSAVNLWGTIDHLYLQTTSVSPTAGLITLNTGTKVRASWLAPAQRNGLPQPLFDARSGPSSIEGSTINEATLSGTGSASNIEIARSAIYAPGLTDSQVNTFASSSDYDLDDQDGKSIVHGGTVSLRAQSYRVLADYVSSSTVLRLVPGLSFWVAANKKYQVRCDLYYRSAAGGALQLAFAGPSSPESVIIGASIQTDVSGSQKNGVSTAFFSKTPKKTVGVRLGAMDFVARATASIENGSNPGTVQLQVSSIKAVPLTIIRGSTCIVN